ncbi:MAG: hypothetical protein ABI586_07085, partial [Candidatus Nanopelagicales bacterium]
MNQIAYIGVAQWTQLKTCDAGESAPLGHCRAQWVTTMEIVTAVRGDDGHWLTELAREQEAEQLTCRLVSPMHVLDDDEQGCTLRQPFERRAHRLEQLGAINAFEVRLVTWFATNV